MIMWLMMRMIAKMMTKMITRMIIRIMMKMAIKVVRTKKWMNEFKLMNFFPEPILVTV